MPSIRAELPVAQSGKELQTRSHVHLLKQPTSIEHFKSLMTIDSFYSVDYVKPAYSTLQSHDFEISVASFDYTHLKQMRLAGTLQKSVNLSDQVYPCTHSLYRDIIQF